ncbi:hypothetical protein PRUPE_5G053700 [Prunus persica]|uniref:Uncharacterized protein n=1 Tax=Prunus persica TaxID=3760 RepID=A0A251P423_PRUPE|nr:hypothetical protein PRUPE_5G053700 [Prunus persica]
MRGIGKKCKQHDAKRRNLHAATKRRMIAQQTTRCQKKKPTCSNQTENDCTANNT